MQINQSEIKDLTAVLSLTIEPADYQEAVQQELKKIRQKAQIPGFRPGMVPVGLVKKMYGKGVLADVLNRLVGENLQKHIEDNDLHVLGDPMPNNELTKNIDLDNEDTFTFAFDIAVAPEFDAKLNGKNKLTRYTIEVTDEMVDKQVQSYAERFGEYVEVDDVKEGDVLRGLLTEQKEEGIVKENAILNPQYMKDKKQQKLFAKAKKGDIITFNPMKAYGSEVEVSSMLSITKEQATGLESDFTFEIQSVTRHQAAKIDKYKFGLDAKEAIMKKMEKVAFPEDFLKRWVLNTDDKMTAEQLDKEFPAMLEQLKWQLAKDQLMKAYDIKIEKEDVEAYAKEVARMQFMQYGLMHVDDKYLENFAQDMLKKEDQLRGIVERVAENKIYEAVQGAAKIEDKTISHEDFGKLFA